MNTTMRFVTWKPWKLKEYMESDFWLTTIQDEMVYQKRAD